MCMNEIGKMINWMGKGNILSKMVRLKVATMRMGNSFSEGKRQEKISLSREVP